MAVATQQQSPAVAIALAHIEAWTNHDFDAARSALAPDVHVTVTSTIEGLPKTETVGVDDYMTGLVPFAQAVVRGSARIEGSIGDDRNALVLVTVQLAEPPLGPAMLPAARLYRLDESDKIAAEQVVFYVAAG